MNFAVVRNEDRVLTGLEEKFNDAAAIAKENPETDIYLIGETRELDGSHIG